MTHDPISRLVEATFPDMVTWRRHLHRNPEISYKEYDTTAFILDVLQPLGYEIHRPLETGCVAVLKGEKPGGTVALRADIDALPMDEYGEAKEAFKSTRPGAAHCCGHDAHTANLLGAAHVLAGLKPQLAGIVVLVFQPGEEKLPGGGRLLTENGILKRLGVEAIFGLHTDPWHPAGTISLRDGAFMARPDEVDIEIIGKGGHAAKPHEAVDPIVMGAHFITMVQTIVSRHINPVEPCVVTFGQFTGGTVYNVIPEKVTLKGTVRTFRKEVAQRIFERMESILKGVTEAAGGTYTFRINHGYPAVINPEKLNAYVRETAKRTTSGVVELDEPIMAGEDFGFYQETMPGVFFYLGSGSEACDSRWAWHHPRYNVDESAMRTGAEMMVRLATGDWKNWV
jgi:amidohydrolase